MFCSTIIPTIGRPTLAAAIESVLAQTCREPFEVIVVNDAPAPLAPSSWQAQPQVRVIDTRGRERSVARNVGAAIARGHYLHFLDDDDVLLPGALAAFLRASQTAPDALWLFGGWRTVDNEGRTICEFKPAIAGNLLPRLVSGEGLPLQASLVRDTGFALVGGFDARPSFTGVEDRDLGRRLALAGAAHWVDALVAQVRIGEVGSSTNWRAIGEGDRLGRENVLVDHRTMGRILEANPSSFWRGRVARALIGSALLNRGRGAWWTAAGRMLQAIRVSHVHVFAPSFWRGTVMHNREGD